MSGKMTQRRRQLDSKRSSSNNVEQSNGNANAALAAAAAAARRRNQHRHFPSANRSKFDYLYKSLLKRKFPVTIPSYLVMIIVGILIAFSSYRIFQSIKDYRSQYEYTNVPIPLPKLVNVNDTSPEVNAQRFWGTYR